MPKAKYWAFNNLWLLPKADYRCKNVVKKQIIFRHFVETFVRIILGLPTRQHMQAMPSVNKTA
jgi:hypothetical protein